LYDLIEQNHNVVGFSEKFEYPQKKGKI